MTDSSDTQIVGFDKVNAVLVALQAVTEGPRDAFGVLVIAILKLYEMNAEMTGNATSNEELLEEIRIAIESAKVVYEPRPN